MTPSHYRFAFLALLTLTFLAAACAEEAEPDAPAPAQAEEAEAAPQPAPETRLYVNTATEDELMTIPNVGERMVHEFEEYRPYVSIQQFRREIGKYVDEEQVAAYERYIYVPVRYNDSDAATLAQLPGLDADEAETLMEARPFASQDAFIEALGEYVSEDELATAQQYLAAEE